MLLLPDDVGVVQLVPDVTVGPGRAVEVFPWHAERRDQHGDATEEEDRAGDREEPPHQDEPETTVLRFN
jgi:hypothetical protein